MKRSLSCASLGVALLLLALPMVAVAENLMTPTEQHKSMADDVGVWDAEVSMWMSPEAEPMKSKAVETNKMLGKMWLMSDFQGDFGGEKFVGASAVGYDPIKKKYIGGWVDSMSPFMMKMEGDYDQDSKTLTMIGEAVDAMTGKPGKYKMVTTYKSKEAKTFEMYRQDESDDEKWVKSMLIDYTRRK